MKRKILYQLSIVVTVIMTSAFTCKSVTTPSADDIPMSGYDINGAVWGGQGNNNTTLKAIEVPCNANNTLRLYYSPLANFGGADTVLTIVTQARASNLQAKECYLEVTTSETDTWLSTGTGAAVVKVTKSSDLKGPASSPQRDFYTFTISQAPLRHFTSVALNDFGQVTSVELTTKRF